MPMVFDYDEWLESETLTHEEAFALLKAIRVRESQGPWSVSMSKDGKKVFIRRDGPTAYIGSAKQAEKFTKLIEAKFKTQQPEAANDTNQDDSEKAA